MALIEDIQKLPDGVIIIKGKTGWLLEYECDRMLVVTDLDFGTAVSRMLILVEESDG